MTIPAFAAASAVLQQHGSAMKRLKRLFNNMFFDHQRNRARCADHLAFPNNGIGMQCRTHNLTKPLKRQSASVLILSRPLRLATRLSLPSLGSPGTMTPSPRKASAIFTAASSSCISSSQIESTKRFSLPRRRKCSTSEGCTTCPLRNARP